jgi:glycosyltransferase 2 family protein
VLLRVLTSLPVRAAVTLALLGALLAWIDWSQFAERLGQGRWELFAAGVALVVVALLIGGLRWHVFIRAGDVGADMRQTLRAYWIGMFANNFLPTGFGGDAARALVIARAGHSGARAVASVVVDRLSALGCLLLLAWLAVAIAPDDVPSSLVTVLGLTTAVGVVATSGLALGARRGGRAGAGTLLRRLHRLSVPAWNAVGGRDRLRSVVAVTTVLGLLYQGTMVLASWLLARAIDLDVSYTLLAVVMPLVLVATLVPISIAGFGVREGGYVALLAEAGISAGDATLFSLLNVAALAIATLPGAFALMLPAVTKDERRRLATQRGEHVETVDAAPR